MARNGIEREFIPDARNPKETWIVTRQNGTASRFLFRGVHPHTGRPLTDRPRSATAEEIAETILFLSRKENPSFPQSIHPLFEEKFLVRPELARKKSQELGIIPHITIEVRKDELPENERAFFMGLSSAGRQTKKSTFGTNHFITVLTESNDGRRRELYRKTFGTWGETHETKDGTRVYLDSPTFDFLLEKRLPEKFLKTKKRFAPFVFALVMTKLTDKTNRMTLPDGKELKQINDWFEKHFGRPLGFFSVEKRGVSVITIKDPHAVLALLVHDQNVHSLPFFRALGEIGSNTNGNISGVSKLPAPGI